MYLGPQWKEVFDSDTYARGPGSTVGRIVDSSVFGHSLTVIAGSYGVACRALIKGLCGGDAARFGHMEVRFAKPVYPGDRLDTLIWRTDDGAQFRVMANGERISLDRGVFRYRA